RRGNTLKAYDIIRDRLLTVLSGESGDDYPCWCVIGYSWGGGQAFRVAEWLVETYPGLADRVPLYAALTIDPIQVAPDKRDTTHDSLTGKVPGARYHANWRAAHSYLGVGGVSLLPHIDVEIRVPRSDHVSIHVIGKRDSRGDAIRKQIVD